MAKPKLLVLDEPMASINPALVAQISLHLRELRDRGITLLMVEHNLEAVDELCDDVVVMAEGRSSRAPGFHTCAETGRWAAPFSPACLSPSPRPHSIPPRHSHSPRLR